jgi:hypothetical protein
MPAKRPRLPTIPKEGDWKPFSTEQIEEIEHAYGQGPLPAQVLLKLQLATILYTAAAPIEKAVPIDDFIHKLTQVQDAAKHVRELVLPTALNLNPNKKSVASKKVGFPRQVEIINQYFAVKKIRLVLRPTSIFDLLAHALTAADVVCEFTAKEIADVGYTHWLWKYWIAWLTMIVKEHRLPYKVRTDSDKSKGQISPFVRLVEALQDCIAKESRHSTRDFALAKAINRARHGTDTDCKFTDLIDLEIFPGAEKELKRLEKQS